MGFEKSISFFRDNWSEQIENLFASSFEYINDDIYLKLFQLFCEKKYSQGIVYLIRYKSNITKNEVELLNKFLDEYTLKDIILTLLEGVAGYSKILYILENLQGAWVVEYIFYVFVKMNVKSLNVINIGIFVNNLEEVLRNSPISVRHNILTVLEKNFELWYDIPSVWNCCLKYEQMYLTFINYFFSGQQSRQKDKTLLSLIEPQHYINILNFLMKTHYADKDTRNNFYQFLFTSDSTMFFKAFLEYIRQMTFAQLSQYAANFSTIPFLDIALKDSEFNGMQLLYYLFFIYSCGLTKEVKLKAIEDILNSNKSIDMNSFQIDDVPYEFIDNLINLNINVDSALAFVFDIVDKKGDYNFVQKLRNRYNEVSDKFKERINEIFIKYSLKSVILDEKREVNLNSFVDVLKKLPFNVTEDIVSLVYNSNPKIKMRLIKLVELLNYDKGIQSIIEALIYKEKDKKVRATCVKLLKSLREEEALKHLRVLMFDDDPRVRANAIEIFEYFANADNWFVLLALANDENNRVRGNVAKAIYPFSRKHSIDIIKDMLNNNKELFVLSALWVIEKLNIADEFHSILHSIEQKFIGQKIKNRLSKLGVPTKQ